MDDIIKHSDDIDMYVFGNFFKCYNVNLVYLTQSSNLPQHHSKRPHIALACVHIFAQSLDCHPSDGHLHG